MKIRPLLENNMLTFRDLTTMQVSVLRRLANGKISIETLTPRDEETLDILAGMGLVDPNTYELTERGQQIAALASKYSSFQTKSIGARDRKLGREPFGKDRPGYRDNSELEDELEADSAQIRLKNVGAQGALANIGTRDDV